MKKFFVAIVVLVSFTQLFAKTYLDGVYHNGRFGFAISYPRSIFTQKEYADNGSGILLKEKSSNIKLRVGAMFEIDKKSPKELYKESLGFLKSKKEVKVTYKVQKSNWYVISGHDYSKDEVFYTKEYLINGVRSGFTITYPIKVRKRVDNIIGEISKSFKPSKGEL